MDAMTLRAILTLDSSEYNKGLNKAESSAKSIGGKIGGAFGKVGSTIGGALKAGIGAVVTGVGIATTAVTAFAGSSVKTGMDFDASMSQVAATMGKTSADLANEIGKVDTAYGTFSGNIRDYALFMGKNTKFSATEAADALNYMALAGYNTQQSMEMLPNVLNLAAAGNMDLALASDMVTDTQTAFGITAERTTKMVDEMARASSTGNTNVQQLGEAFLVVGGLAQELNGGLVKMNDGTTKSVDGVQELEIALTAMANAGVKGSEAGTHMRNMLLKLSDPTDKGTKALKAMGVTIFDETTGAMRSLTDIMGDLNREMSSMTQEERIKTVAALFNTRDMASAKALLNAVTGEYVKMGDEILSVDEAYAKFGDDIYDSSKGFEYVKTSWDEIGESILGASEAGILYKGQVYSMEEAQKKFGDAIHDTGQGFQILGAAEMMAMEQTNNLDGDLTKMNSALEYAKITISDKLTPTLREFVQFGTDGIAKIADAFKEGGLSGAMEAFGTILSDGLNMILEKLPDFVNAGVQLLSALGQGLMDNLDVIIDAGIQVLSQFGQAIVTGLPAIIEAGLQILEALLSAFDENFDTIAEAAIKLLEGIGEAVDKHKDSLREVATSILTKLSEFLIENLDKIAGFVTEMLLNFVNWVTDNAGTIIETAITIITTLADGLVNAIPELVPAVVDMILAIAEGLLDNLDQIISAAIDIIVALGEGLIKAIPELVKAIPQIVESLVTALVSNIPRILMVGTQLIVELGIALVREAPRIVMAGVDILLALIQGIMDAIPNLIKTGQDVVNHLWEAIKSLNPIEWGQDMMDSFIQGIKDRISKIKEAAEDIAGTIKGILGFSEPDEGPLSNFHTFAPDMMNLFIKGIKDNEKRLQDQVAKSFDFGNMTVSASPTVQASGVGMGGSNNITLNVYGAEGQDVRALADLVSERLLHEIGRTGAVYA